MLFQQRRLMAPPHSVIQLGEAAEGTAPLPNPAHPLPGSAGAKPTTGSAAMQLMAFPFHAALLLAVLTSFASRLDLGEVGLFLRFLSVPFTTAVMLLLFRRVRDLQLEGRFQEGEAFLGKEKFKPGWQSLIMALGVTQLACLLTPIPVPRLPTPPFSILPTIHTATTAAAAAATDAATPLLFLLFPLLLFLILRCAIRGSERLNHGQGPYSFLAWRPLFLAVTFILSCSMLQGAQTTPLSTPVSICAIAVVLAVVVFVIIATLLGLTSSPPTEITDAS